MEFKGQSILTASQFDREGLEKLFILSERMKRIASREVRCEVLNGYILLNLFFEPSTRTRMSFSTAFQRLGGSVDNTHGVRFSSLMKGETLADTIRVMSAYGDVLVLRTPKKGEVAEASEYSAKPIINAGDGAGEHPTQALLDCFTILDERGKIDGQTIAFSGDLKHGRTVHSNVQLLSLFKDVRFVFISPSSLRLPENVKAILQERKIYFEETDQFKDGIREADVIYSTRIQEERFEDKAQYSKVRGIFVLNRKLAQSVCKKDVTILHPLPRVDELSADLDSLPNAAYFRQSANGVPVRMALSLMVLGKEKKFV